MFNRSLTIASIMMVILTLVLYTNTAKAQVIGAGLAGYWTLDEADIDAETVKDFLGEHDGTIQGEPEIVEGIVGEALSFDGEEDYIVIGPVTDGLDITYSLWINIPALPGASQVILWDDDSNGGGDSWFQLMSDGTIQTQRGGDGFGVFNSNTPIVPGEWTHITFVSDEKNDKKTIYLNGEPDGDSGGTVTTRTNVSHVVLGVGHDGNAFISLSYFNGAIDEVIIYNRALSDEEILKNATPLAVNSAGKLSITWGRIKTE